MKLLYNFYIMMLDHPNLRYHKSSITSKTTTFYRSSTPQKVEQVHHSAFKLRKVLPKLDQSNPRIEVSTDYDEKEQKERVQEHKLFHFYRSQPRESISITKIGIRSRLNDREIESCSYQAVSKQGKRPYNEDRYLCQPKIPSPFMLSRKQQTQLHDLYAVFDGHGGSKCAEFLRQNFPILLSRSQKLQANPEEALFQAFSKVEDKFLTLCQSKEKLETSGACAVVCLVRGDKIVVANLGDCRAMLLSKEGFLVLTRDHKPEDRTEKIRIIRHGGKIYRQQEGLLNQIKIFRQSRIVPGNLNVSRTLGDAEVKLKKYGGLPGMISSVPEVATFPCSHYSHLLMASDGLFEAFSCQQIYSKFLNCLPEDLPNFTDTLAFLAEQKSSDNITIVTVPLKK